MPAIGPAEGIDIEIPRALGSLAHCHALLQEGVRALKKRDLAVVIAFWATTILCGVAFLRCPRRIFWSEMEQDDFGSAFKSYGVDHIPLRKLLVVLNAYFDLLTGRDGLNSAYIGRDGYLSASPIEKNDTGFARNLRRGV